MFASMLKRMEFLRALHSRPFAMIWIGQSISNLGDGIFYIALAWQVLLMTHSATDMGIVLIAGMIPRLAFVLIGGVTADRISRRLIVLWSDSGRGVVVLIISILGFSGHLQFWLLVVEALLFGVVDGFFNPAVLAITPDLVDKEDLTSANALISLGGTIAQLLGPALGAGLIALTGPMGAFAANALSFFISVAFLLPVRIPERHLNKPLMVEEPNIGGVNVEGVPSIEVEAVVEEKTQKRRGIRDVLADVAEGMVYVRNSRWLWVTLINASVGNLGIMAALVTSMPKLVYDVYGQGAWLLGLIGTTEAVGSALGILLVGQATRLKKRGLLAYLSMTLNSAGVLIFGLPFPRSAAPIIAPLASVLVGFGIAFFNTIYFTILQERIPSEKLGRVISLDTLGSFAMIPVGEAIGGILTDHIGPALVFIIFGAFNIVNSLIPLLVREVRETE
jgi:MFS family permease